MPPKYDYRVSPENIQFLMDRQIYSELVGGYLKPIKRSLVPKIKKVIFNNPATIVFWADHTKTVVKCNGEEFDPEKGLAMAISKKALGNQGNYFNEIKKWVEPYEVEHMFDNCPAVASNLKELRDYHLNSKIDEAMTNLKKSLNIKSPSEMCGFNKED